MCGGIVGRRQSSPRRIALRICAPISRLRLVKQSPYVDERAVFGKVLGVSHEELIDDADVAARRKPGPKSVIEKRLVRIEKLSRTQKETVLRMLDGLLENAS